MDNTENKDGIDRLAYMLHITTIEVERLQREKMEAISHRNIVITVLVAIILAILSTFIIA
jgi:hypothetical protein